jgi:hypothetical protein
MTDINKHDVICQGGIYLHIPVEGILQ